MLFETSKLLLIGILVSLMGFCIENLFLCIGRGYIDNRNMVMPFLMGYGVGVIGFYLILGVPENGNTLVYFGLSSLAVSVGEILIGKTAEHLLGFVYWDYSKIPLHITRYTSIPTAMGFGLAVTLFMKHWFFPILRAFSLIPVNVRRITGVSMTILMTADFLYSFLTMYRKQAPNFRWKLQLFRKRSNPVPQRLWTAPKSNKSP